MSWKDIVKEDLTEKVIEALIPLYGSRKEVIESNMMGVRYEEELKDMPPFTKEDVKNLIKDIEFAARNAPVFGEYPSKEEVQKVISKLEELL